MRKSSCTTKPSIICRYDFQVDSETLRLPTLKELIGYSTVVTDSIADLTSSLAPPTKTFRNRTIDNNALRYGQIDRNVTKNRLQNLIQDLLNEDNDAADENDAREVSSLTDKEIYDNDVLGSEEVQQRSYSSSFVTSTKEIVGNNDTGQSFKRIEVPVKILDDADGEEIAQLVLLRLPESKLNSPAFKPVFRVKILEQDQQVEHKDVKRNGVESSSVSSENSSENELSENRIRPSRRRRVGVNTAQVSSTLEAPTTVPEGRIGERNRPRNRQEIVNGWRRSRITEAPLDRSSEGLLDNHEDERPVRVQEDGRVSERRYSVDNESENSTPAYSAETPTTIRITTSRGKRPTSSKPSNGIHGFYITRSSDEIVAPIIDATTTDPSIDSTKYPLTISDERDESTQSTGSVIQNQETSIPQVADVNPTTEENSTFESTTIGEVETTTRVTNEMDSFEDLLKTTLDKSKAVTVDYGSTIEDRIAESFTTTIMKTADEQQDLGEPSITTFRPFTTNEPTSNPTIIMDSTPEYSTGSTEDIDKYASTNLDETTGYVAETLKASENNYYGSSTTTDIKSSTVPMTTEENNVRIMTQSKIPIRITTKIPMSRTTDLVDTTTTHTTPSKRGRVRFTALSKSAGSAAISARDQSRRITKISEYNDSRRNSVSGSEVRRRSSTSTEAYDEKVESTTPGDIGNRAYTSRSSSRSRNRQRNTIKSNGTDNSKSDSIVSQNVTKQSVTEVETSARVTEANILTTNFVETTFLTEFDRGQKTTQALEFDDIRFNSVTPIGFTSRNSASTKAYDKTVEPTITTTETSDLTTNFITTEVIYNSKIPETDDYRINSVTPLEFTSRNDITTAVYDETVDSEFTTTEAIDPSTSFVETTTSSLRFSTEIDDYSRKSTSFEIDDTTINSTTLPTSTADENSENMTMTSEAEESTESIFSTSKSSVTDDSTSTSTTSMDIFATNAITVESYDTTINDSVTTENSEDFNGKSYTTSLSEAGTTEINETITDSLEPVRTVDFIVSEETMNPKESTNSKDTTTTSEASTISSAYTQQTNLTEIADENQTESVNILSQVTLTSRDVTAMNTYVPTTEIYITTEMPSTVESGIADVRIDEEKQTSTEAVQEMDETVTISEMKMETTEQSFSTITTITPADTIVENIETTASSASKTTPPISNRDLNVLQTTIKNNDKTLDPPKFKSVTSSIPRETKRSRGRIRFTNFAGHSDEVGRHRRPVKQVVVRRRLANPSNNQRQIHVSTEETENAERHEIEEQENTRKLTNEHLPEIIRNSTKWMRRRVVKIGNSAEARTDANQPANKKKIAFDQLSEEKGNITKLNNRRVVKIIDSTENKTNFEQSEVVDQENTRNITDESLNKQEKKPTKWMRRRLVKIGNSSEDKTNIDRSEIRDQENINKVAFESLDGKTTNSGKWARRRVVKIGNPSENKINLAGPEIEESENVKKIANEQLAEEKRNSTKSMRRRVVVYRGRPRAESVTTTTMQSTSFSSDEVSEDIGKTRRRKWRKRLVLKRAKSDDLDDQNIAETGHFHQAVIDDSVDEDLGALGSHITEPVVHQLVNSAERDDDVIGDGEVNIYKSSGSFLRRPGTLIRPEGVNRSRLSSGTLFATTPAAGPSAPPFSKIRPAEFIKSQDQSGRAQELAVTLADPPEIRATSTTGRLPFRKTTRKISTTIAPRTVAPTTSRTTPVSRRRQRPRGNSNIDKIVETVSTRPRRPAIIDYDYYVDDEVRLVLKPELKDKLFVTRKGGIRCLDQGNFAHPTSCKKFITCARMVNGQVLGTEYTCPDKLSFDPVGGICNWSAGLGCEDKSNT